MRDKDLFCGVILKNIVNLGRKVRNWRLVRSDDFFFRDHCISETKNVLPGMISGNDFFFFFRDHLKSRTKTGLEYAEFYDLVLACQLHD